jgi:hypothetical protein
VWMRASVAVVGRERTLHVNPGDRRMRACDSTRALAAKRSKDDVMSVGRQQVTPVRRIARARRPGDRRLGRVH